MADPIDSKYFGFVPATEEQQGNSSADEFGLGQFVPSAAVVSSSIGAAGDHQQQGQQQQHTAMANVVKTEQQQHNEEDGQVEYEQLIPTIPSLLGEDTNRLDV